MRAPVDVVIVGGGASGVLVAARLLDASVARATRITIVEQTGCHAAGVAYGTEDLDHLLNVRAGGMSADPSHPGEFADWVAARGLGDANTFVPRRHYRSYLRHHLDQAADDATNGALDLVTDRVVGIEPGRRWTVRLASGRDLSADRVVLATGNASPGTPAPLRSLTGHPAWVADPWAHGALDRARESSTVLLIGAGLTMVDIAITLGRESRAQLIAVSRHGLLPRAHLPHRPQHEVDVVELDRDSGDLTGLTRRIRDQATACDHDPTDDDWRDVVDSVRPYVNALWQRASTAERGTFLRHLSRHWDVHRHRMSPTTADRLRSLLDSGRLTNHQGRVVDAVASPGDADSPGRVILGVHLDGTPRRLAVDAVVNCTGPGRSWNPPANAAVDDLVRRGLATPDPHGIGLTTTTTGRLVDQDGKEVSSIFVIGPPRRGTLFETTAIPEVRSQALHIADQIVAGDPFES